MPHPLPPRATGLARPSHLGRPVSVVSFAVLVALTTDCASSSSAPPATAKAPSGSSGAAATGAPAAGLPFIEDDYARALGEARSSHRLLFVDAWAPWCHTCLSMRAYTFRDAKVRARAGEMVWAAIDTEKPENAGWVSSHPMHSWPTLYVVDAESGKTVLEWPNSATADELGELLDLAHARAHSDVGAKEKRDWPSPAATVESLLSGLYMQKDYAACAETAERELPKIARGGARAATFAVMCVAELPPGEARRPALDRAVQRARTMAVDETEPMLPDDRSGLYEVMVDALAGDGRDAESKAVAKQWAAFLEGEARRAPDPTARAVFDAHRVEAYLALGTPELAIPMLQASAHDFPADYNPPARLARAYLAMKRYDDAALAIDRALALVYGPRSLRLYATKADILEAKGDRAGAAAALRDGITRARTAALPPRYAASIEELVQRERALENGH